MSALDEFREAWNNAQGDSIVARLTRQSLEAAATESEALSGLLFELKHKHQAELELHLDGPSVHEHSTNAEKFANLLRGFADAVKEITKSALDRERMVSNLLVVAPVPGSVQVILRAAPPSEVDGHFDIARSETQDSNSLRLVATLIARANDDDPQGAIVEGLLSELPARARPGIRRIARAVSESDWVIEGTLRRPREQDEKIHLQGAGARRLLVALDAREVERSEVAIEGHVDGQRWSLGTMWFAPLVGAPIEGAVIDQELLQQVAALGAASRMARATFDVVTQHPPGTAGALRKSYVLKAIEEVPQDSVELEGLGV